MNKREEIYEIKENIYSANIEKRKLNEKLYSLNEISKKVEDGYNSYKEISDKVDEIKGVKDVLAFKNINLKSRVPAKKPQTAKRDMTYKAEITPTEEFVAASELKDSFNKLHYNDKMTLEEDKVYTENDCKELLTKNTSSSSIVLYAALSENTKYELQNSFCENMIVAYPTLDMLREKVGPESDLLVVDINKNAHYIPAMTESGNFCALVGGSLNVIYKEKINTGKESVSVWHVKCGK